MILKTKFFSGALLKYMDHNGNIFWIDENCQPHKDDGPAILYKNGAKKWCQHGKLHRLDGPAVIEQNYKEWWIEGKEIESESEFLRIIKMKYFM
jgi:hypothetical protein